MHGHTRSVPLRPPLIASNRGPVAFATDDRGRLVATKTGGGLASAMAPLLGSGATWVCAALSDADRRAAAAGATPDGVELVDIPPDVYDRAYGRVANETLWFAHHGLLDASAPAIDDADLEAFDRYSALIADRIVATAPPRAAVLVQDYHLCRVGPLVRAARPDVALVHFSHTPFAEPAELPGIDARLAAGVVEAMSAHDACGFHSGRWAAAFEATCRAHGVEPPPTFVSPLAPDADRVRDVANSPAGRRARRALDDLVGDRAVVTRVDRIEPTKNVLAGFDAYDRLLRDHPEWHGAVVFVAYVYPSRGTIDRYRRLRDDIVATVQALNDRHGTPTWRPVHLDLTDDLPAAVAAMQRYDVLLVNPVRDGLNLVAMEGPLLNRRHGRLVLSTGAGAHDLLGDHALSVDPHDVAATADALHRALTMATDEAAGRAEALHAAVTARTPATWLAEQLARAG